VWRRCSEEEIIGYYKWYCMGVRYVTIALGIFGIILDSIYNIKISHK
jgi:hypothetical protein